MEKSKVIEVLRKASVKNENKDLVVFAYDDVRELRVALTQAIRLLEVSDE